MNCTLPIPVSETLSFLRYDKKCKDFLKQINERHHVGEIKFNINVADETKKTTLSVRDDNDICDGSATPMGVYGFYENPNYKAPVSDQDQDPNPDQTQDQTPNPEQTQDQTPNPDPNPDQDQNPDQTQPSDVGRYVYYWIWRWGLQPDSDLVQLFGECSDELTKLREKMITPDSTDNASQELLNKTLTTMFSNIMITSEDPMLVSFIQSVLTEHLELETVYNVVTNLDENMYLSFGVKNINWYEPVVKADIIQDEDDDNE